MTHPDDSRLDVDTQVSNAWQAFSQEEPPAALDDAIRAASRREVSARPRRRSSPPWIPLAVAATIGVVAIGIVQLTPPERVTAGASVSDAEVSPAVAPPPRAATSATPQQGAMPESAQADALRRANEATANAEVARAERLRAQEQGRPGERGRAFAASEPPPQAPGASAVAPEDSRRAASAQGSHTAVKSGAPKAAGGTPPTDVSDQTVSTSRQRSVPAAPDSQSSRGSAKAAAEPGPAQGLVPQSAPSAGRVAQAFPDRSSAARPAPSGEAPSAPPVAAPSRAAQGRAAPSAEPLAPTAPVPSSPASGPPAASTEPPARTSSAPPSGARPTSKPAEDTSSGERDAAGRIASSANTAKRESGPSMAQSPAARGDTLSQRGRAQRPVPEWIAYIRRLRSEGRTEEAAKELAAFHALHAADAEALLPDDLKQPQPAK